MHKKTKPPHIDKKAKMKYNQWHRGKLLKKKLPIGRYTIWDAEENLLHDGEYTREGKIIWFTSYYPDETIGREVSYNEDTKSTKVIYKSYTGDFSSLITPLRKAEKGYAEKIYQGQLSFDYSELFNGSPEGVSFYTEEGQLINTYVKENYAKLVRKYYKESKDEKWETALLRLKNYWTALKAQLIKDNISYDDYFSPSFTKGVTIEDIKKAEERLGLSLPKSYKTFILEQGLLTFGGIRDNYGNLTQRLLHPSEINTVEYLLDEDGEGKFEEYYQVSKEKRSKIIVFFIDQEDIQYERWMAFDCTNEIQNEVGVVKNIGSKNIHEWESQIGKKTAGKSTAMDKFIAAYVNKLIKA